MQLDVRLAEEHRKRSPERCNVFTPIPFQNTILVQLIDNSRVRGCIDTLNRAGLEIEFELLEEVSRVTLEFFPIKKKKKPKFL